MLMNACYVILYRESTYDSYRLRNIKFVVTYLKQIPNLDILIIEQDSKETVIKQFCNDNNIQYAFIKNAGLFNRAWAFNCFHNFTNAKRVILGDGDIIVDKSVIARTISALHDYDIVRPYSGYVNDLSNDDTLRLINEGRFVDVNLRNIFNFSGGVCAFRTDSFYNILGGFDERFEGWGGEDDEMHIRIFEHSFDKLSLTSSNQHALHMFHKRTQLDGNQQPNYLKNVSYIRDGKRNDGIQQIGNINRYV